MSIDNLPGFDETVKAQLVAYDIKNILSHIPAATNFNQIKILSTGDVLLGRNSYTVSGKQHSSYPIIFYRDKTHFILNLCDKALTVDTLLNADADMPTNETITVTDDGLNIVFETLQHKAKILISEGLLTSRVKSVDDYIFLYLCAKNILDKKSYDEGEYLISRKITAWLNTGMDLDKILFYMNKKDPDYTPENYKDYCFMPLDEII